MWFDDVAMAVMVHSRQFHSAPGDWDMTVARDAQLTECGVIVVGTTPNRIYRDIDSVIGRIHRTYAVASSRPRPAVSAIRQPVIPQSR